MNPIYSVPISGLLFQSKRLANSASNVVNIGSNGVRTDRVDTNDNGFVPHRVVGATGPEGGVRSKSVPQSPPSTMIFDPQDPSADENGLVARPNVSLEQEMVTQLQAQRAYEANLKVLQTLDRMVGRVLDLES